MEHFPAWRIQPLVRVRPEVVALGLQQVGGEAGAAVAVEVVQGGAKDRGRQAELNRGRQHATPARLGLLDRRLEEVVEQQVLQVRVLVERRLDVAQEPAANDAAAAPQEGDVAVVELPAELLGGGVELDVTLCVAAEFAGLEGLLHVFDKLLLIRN